jgi:hypothetical protein
MTMSSVYYCCMQSPGNIVQTAERYTELRSFIKMSQQSFPVIKMATDIMKCSINTSSTLISDLFSYALS